MILFCQDLVTEASYNIPIKVLFESSDPWHRSDTETGVSYTELFVVKMNINLYSNNLFTTQRMAKHFEN